MGSKVGARALMEEAGVPVVPGARARRGRRRSPPRPSAIGYPAARQGLGRRRRQGHARRSPRRPSSRTRSRARGARPRPRSATRTSSSSACSSGRATSRSRSSPTPTARRSASASASARSSAATRRSSRRRPRRASTPSSASGSGAAAVAAAEAVGYVGAGTVEFLLDADGELLLPRDEHPAAGRAPGDRDGPRASTSSPSSCGSPPASRCRRARHASRVDPRPRDRGPALRRGPGRRLPAADRHARRASTIAGAEPFAAPTGRGEPAACGSTPASRTARRVSPHYDPMLAKLIAWAPTRGRGGARGWRAALRARPRSTASSPTATCSSRVLAHAELPRGRDRHRLPRARRGPRRAARRRRGRAARTRSPRRSRRWRDAAAEPGLLAFAPAGFRNNFSEPQRIGFEGADGELEVDLRARARRRGRRGRGRRRAARRRRVAAARPRARRRGRARGRRASRRRYRVRAPRRRPPRQRPRRPVEPARAAPLPGRRGGARRGRPGRADAGQGDQARGGRGRRGRGGRRARRARGDEDGARADRAGRGDAGGAPGRRGRPGRVGRCDRRHCRLAKA